MRRIARSTPIPKATRKPSPTAAHIPVPGPSEAVSGDSTAVPLHTPTEIVGRLPANLQRQHVSQLGQLHGSRRAGQAVAILQRHPGHGKPDESELPAVMLAPWDVPAVMRAEMMPEATSLATVNAADAPLSVHNSIFNEGGLVGQLAAGDLVRVLHRAIYESRIHIERGPLAGRTGWVRNRTLTPVAAPTSQRDPTAGPENAYNQLQTELANVPPDRRAILFIIQTRLTMAQHQQLLQAANPEWTTMMGMAALSANDIIHILSTIGAPLHRKISDYLTKGGNTVEELRLAFASANEEERLAVARDDALVGRLRAIGGLARAHPEIIFGTALAQIYPENGRLRTLRSTNPELSRWLGRHVGAGANLNRAAERRASRLQDAVALMDRRSPRAARPSVLSAIQAAPRGAALGGAERQALDTIEERAYPLGIYNVGDLAVMFLTRFGRPFRNANAQSKTFLHRVYAALKRIPVDHVLFTNVLGWFDVNTDPAAAGSFTDFLSSANFGRLVSDPPDPEVLHASAAVNNSSRVTVIEPTLDLLQPNHQLDVAQADGSTANVQVAQINVPRRQLRLNQPVTVDAGAELRPPEANRYLSGEALQITAPATFYANNAGAPDTGNILGVIQPGNLFSNMRTVAVGPTNYIGGRIHAGPLAGQVGWIEAAGATAVGGGQTMGQAIFEWTARHEMGHALDLQLNGFSRFSGPSAAQWIKYTGVDDWLSALIGTAGIANPDTAQTYPAGGANMTFRQAARTYANAVQTNAATTGPAMTARSWLQGWVAAGGSQTVYDVITQFNANAGYFTRNNLGLPDLNGRIFAAHYNEYFSAAAAARQQSLALGVPPYAYTCTYEFFADHYAAYTAPGVGGAQYARAVPDWAKNFFDRLMGDIAAGPRVGMARHRMGG
jgi:hypothetical protein